MTDIAIHQLPPAGPLTGSESIPIDDGAATVRTTVTALRTGLANMAHSHDIIDVTGLQTALNAKAPLTSPVFTGTVALPTGSVAAPAAGPAGDPDTGLYFPAANTMGLATAGVERLRVSADGRIQVPIGTNVYLGQVSTTPHAAGNAGLVALTIVDGGGHSGVFVQNTHDGTYCSQDVRILLSHGGTNTATERMRVAKDGTLTVGAAPGGESLRVLPAAGATRAVTITGSNGGDPSLSTTGGRLGFGAVPALPSFTVATLPVATARGLIFVSDGAANKRLAVSDGSNWRWPDGTLVS